MQAPGERKTRRGIAKLLKTEGPIDSAQLAERLGLTAMAVRQHLYALQREGLVTAEERPVPIGRPAKFWRLTREADRLFPEAYAELSVALIDSVKDAFGEEGLERVLTSRCARSERITENGSARRLAAKENFRSWRRSGLKKVTWPKSEGRTTEAICWLRTIARFARRRMRARVSVRRSWICFDRCLDRE